MTGFYFIGVGKRGKGSGLYKLNFSDSFHFRATAEFPSDRILPLRPIEGILN